MRIFLLIFSDLVDIKKNVKLLISSCFKKADFLLFAFSLYQQNKANQAKTSTQIFIVIDQENTCAKFHKKNKPCFS